jgi:hypothetical protein
VETAERNGRKAANSSDHHNRSTCVSPLSGPPNPKVLLHLMPCLHFPDPFPPPTVNYSAGARCVSLTVAPLQGSLRTPTGGGDSCVSLLCGFFSLHFLSLSESPMRSCSAAENIVLHRFLGIGRFRISPSHHLPLSPPPYRHHLCHWARVEAWPSLPPCRSVAGSRVPVSLRVTSVRRSVPSPSANSSNPGSHRSPRTLLWLV